MSTRTRLAAATAGLAAVVSTVALATPASAEVFSTSDPAGDVSGLDGPRPEVENGDIRTVRFEHARRTITIRATFRDLARSRDGLEQFVQVRTPARDFFLAVVAFPGRPRGEFFVIEGPERACRGTDHRLDYERDVFTMTIDRTCVRDPRWVRVGLATVTGIFEEETFLVDDALQDGFDPDAEAIELSPRLGRVGSGGSYTG